MPSFFNRKRTQEDPAAPAHRDIYTRRPPTPEEIEAAREEPEDPLEIWKRHQWEERRATWRFVLVTLAFVALVATILFQQVMLTRKPQFSDAPPPTPAPAPGAPNADTIPTLIDAHPVYPHIDALFNLPDTEVAPGPHLLGNHLKGAAQSLVRAEQAFNDEKFEIAVGHFENVIRLIPDVRGVVQYAAICNLQMGRHQEAIKGFQRALNESPNNPALLNNIGAAHLALKQWPEAEENLQSSVRIRPRYYQAQYNLGWLYTQQGRHSKAVIHLEQLRNINPDHFKGLQLYANSLLHLKRFKEAKTALQEIVRETRTAPEPRFKLAQCLAETGDPKSAIEHINAAVKLVDFEAARKRLDSPEFAKLDGEPGFDKIRADLDFDIAIRAP